jgi:hypothetical protein
LDDANNRIGSQSTGKGTEIYLRFSRANDPVCRRAAWRMYTIDKACTTFCVCLFGRGFDFPICTSTRPSVLLAKLFQLSFVKQGNAYGNGMIPSRSKENAISRDCKQSVLSTYGARSDRTNEIVVNLALPGINPDLVCDMKYVEDIVQVQYVSFIHFTNVFYQEYMSDESSVVLGSIIRLMIRHISYTYEGV